MSEPDAAPRYRILVEPSPKRVQVGVVGRLDFTVLGAAVNEVARLEGLSKQLGRSVVASGAFAELVPGRLESLGEHALRGVANPREVFGLPSAVPVSPGIASRSGTVAPP
jgi:class 3 adenylate cyclase